LSENFCMQISFTMPLIILLSCGVKVAKIQIYLYFVKSSTH
jgi:hypothetical protein